MVFRARRSGLIGGLAALTFAWAVPSVAAADDAAIRVQSAGDAIIARVRAAFRSHAQPPFVVYTLSRADRLDGLPVLEDTYTLRIWCRTSDSAALSRRIWHGKAVGGMQFLRPAFNQPLDPGPPTADLFERAPLAMPATSSPSGNDPSGLRTIETITVAGETEYRAELLDDDPSAYHVRLTPRRDAERNRLRELWIDPQSYEIRRAIAHDRLFAGFKEVPERFELRFDTIENVPVVRRIEGATDPQWPGRSAFGLHETSYRFDDIAFPASLPAWYFDPASYGAHRTEAPAR